MRRARPISDIREAVLLRQRDALRAELLKLSKHLTQRLNHSARNIRPRWMLDMEARRVARIAAILRRLGSVDERLWRIRLEANA